ncbi:MAG TPA: hypothetical protein VFO19_12515 [Vicinamibacterales bacterium]|nr:hypothetical protein [Vicinamibacterales bacterium]
MTDVRAAVFEQLAAQVVAVAKSHPTRVAIDGVDGGVDDVCRRYAERYVPGQRLYLESAAPSAGDGRDRQQ